MHNDFGDNGSHIQKSNGHYFFLYTASHSKYNARKTITKLQVHSLLCSTETKTRVQKCQNFVKRYILTHLYGVKAI